MLPKEKHFPHVIEGPRLDAVHIFCSKKFGAQSAKNGQQFRSAQPNETAQPRARQPRSKAKACKSQLLETAQNITARLVSSGASSSAARPIC